jgi:hypothetical protein
VTAALRFNEDAVLPDQIERMTFPALLQATRARGRDIVISIGSELPHLLVAAGFPRGRVDRYSSMNVAALVVANLLPADIPVLHEAMREHAPTYLELIEVDPDLAADRVLYLAAMSPRYRIRGTDLLLQCSPYADRDEDVRDEWESSGLFDTVSWE